MQTTTIGGVSIGGAAILCLAWMFFVRADPYRGYGGVGRGGVVLAALCGASLPIVVPIAGWVFTAFGVLVRIAQSLAEAGTRLAEAGTLG